MPTVVSESTRVRRELWTADDFLDWLQPGVHADLIDGEKFMHSPVNLRHARLLNFVSEGEEHIASRVVAGFCLQRSWLDPENLPDTSSL